MAHFGGCQKGQSDRKLGARILGRSLKDPGRTMTELETARLNLRPYRAGDIELLAALYSDPEVTRHTKLGRLNRAQCEATLAEYLRTWRAKGFGMRAAFLRPGGAFVGECGLFTLPGLGDPALRYAFLRAHWGQGLATEAARATLDHALGAATLERVLSFVEEPNESSHRIMTKLGLRLEKTSIHGDIKLYRYAMSRSDWSATP